MSLQERGKLFESGTVQEVKQFLKENPAWDVNEDLRDGYTALHLACGYGHHEIVSVLVGHPKINVNQKTTHGFTPFLLGCYNERAEAVNVLLKDPRVDINMVDNNGRTPLWRASYVGYVRVIKWMIASGREITNLDRKGKIWIDDEEYTAIEIARHRGHTEVVSLLERFIENQSNTRHRVRAELGLVDKDAAELFVRTVFLCDNFFRLMSDDHSDGNRFFRIISRLPMELQMALCHRVYGSPKNNIPSKNSEPAFRDLARVLA